MFLYLYLNLPCIIVNFTKMNFIIIEFNFSQRPKKYTCNKNVQRRIQRRIKYLIFFF